MKYIIGVITFLVIVVIGVWWMNEPSVARKSSDLMDFQRTFHTSVLPDEIHDGHLLFDNQHGYWKVDVFESYIWLQKIDNTGKVLVIAKYPRNTGLSEIELKYSPTKTLSKIPLFAEFEEFLSR